MSAATTTLLPAHTFARQVHGWGGNVVAIRHGEKRPAHQWEQWLNGGQVLSELDAMPWSRADRVGIINAPGDWRSIDLDNCRDDSALRAILHCLGLPEDYAWAEQSDSGCGYHVWVRCASSVPAGALPKKGKHREDDDAPGVFWGVSKDGTFGHIEIRWERSQTVIAASKDPRRWLHGAPSDQPDEVKIGDVLEAFWSIAKGAEAPPPTSYHHEPARFAAQHDDTKERIRAAFDLVRYAEMRWGNVQRDGNEHRVMGHGGFLINADKRLWYRHIDEEGGDCFDLVGYALHGDAWNRRDARMFREALTEAAHFAGVALAERRDTPAATWPSEMLRNPLDDRAVPSEHEAGTRRYPTYTPGQMKERPAITFAVEDLIPSGGFASLVGMPATYKSFIALDIAASIAARGHWQGRDAERGGVLYVSAEGASGLGQRIGAWETARTTAIPDTFRVMTDAPQLLNDEDVAALVSTAMHVQAEIGVPLRLIVIDTFARTFNGEENSSKEVGEAIAAADGLRRATGAAVLLVHHLNKAGTASRGSSALLGALDVEITATRSDQTVKLAITKAKDFGEGDPIHLTARIVAVDGGGSSLVMEAETPSADSLPAAAKNIALVLDDQFGQLGAAQSVWKKACDEKSFPSETFNRSRRQLLDKGYITAPQEGGPRGHKYRLTREFYEESNMAVPQWLEPSPPNTGAKARESKPSQSVPRELLAGDLQAIDGTRPSSSAGTNRPWYPKSAAIAGDSVPEEDRYHSVPNRYHGTNARHEALSTIGTHTYKVCTVVPSAEECGTDAETPKRDGVMPTAPDGYADNEIIGDDEDSYFPDAADNE